MATTKRKPPTRRTPAPKRNSGQDEGMGDLARWVQSLPPPPTDDAIALASLIRARQGVRDVRFEPMRGVVLMFGYSGLVRVLSGVHMVHIATVDELATMDDQQIYDAVMAAGGKR
jgi:hypothetical protein